MTKRMQLMGAAAASRALKIAALASALPAALPASPAAAATEMPLVRVSESNTPPACATPGRLMAYLYARNPVLDSRFGTIAADYVRLGRELGVRWDYAFFQMIVETGSLAFRRDQNRPGTVKPEQNNFAGLGAASVGQPGEVFPDVATGVKAHLQHLLMYSGQHVDSPVAERTRKVQQWGVLVSWHKSFRHPIGFTDVARRWATDPSYAENISAVAHRFYEGYCVKDVPDAPLASAARGTDGTSGSTSGEPRAYGLELARAAIERARQDDNSARRGLGFAPDTIAPTSPPTSPISLRNAVASAPPAGEHVATKETPAAVEQELPWAAAPSPAPAPAPSPVRTAALTPTTPASTSQVITAPSHPVVQPAPQVKPVNAADEAVRQMVSGKTFILDAAMGLTIPIVVHVNGSLRGSASGVAASYLGAPVDEGRWWVSHGRLCQRWNVWLDRETQCMKLHQAGAVVHWVRDDGRTGTARIASR